MILLFIWFHLVFIFQLSGFGSTMIHTPKRDRLLHYWRMWVVVAHAREDPCSRNGMWVFITDEQQKKAHEDCEEAYNVFVGLSYREQKVCLNAAAPKCRPSSYCEHLMYICTFLCDGSTVQRLNESTGMLEEVTEQTQKGIKTIAEEMSRNLGIPNVSYRI